MTKISIGSEKGEGLVAALVSLLLSLVVVTATVSNFMTASRLTADSQHMSETQNQAKTVLDMMAYELRMMGSGMPLGQAGFAIGDAVLGTSTLPVLLTSNASAISFRLNQLGENTVLTASYTPSAASLTFAVYSTADLVVGDTIYISNGTVGGIAGLQGVVSSLTATTVTITAGFVSTAATTFNAGSTVERVTLIDFISPNDWSGITRTADGATVVIAPNSQFTLSYRDTTGTTMVLPMTEATVATNLASVVLTVNVRSERALLNGSYYTATAEQVVALRNLIRSR